jgi:hypothetical protein
MVGQIVPIYGLLKINCDCLMVLNRIIRFITKTPLPIKHVFNGISIFFSYVKQYLTYIVNVPNMESNLVRLV